MVETPRSAYAGGGFLPNTSTSLPSPAPSTASSRAAARLPHPRSKPLPRGSRKEDYARNYVSDRLMHISRRYVKKHGIPDPADEVMGYEGMDEVCRDLEEVVDVLWFSGTPSLQIPYLLNVALAFNTYLPAFPPSPRPTFALLKKLDHCFASLMVGRDVKSGDPLPGFEKRGFASVGFTSTDMVRCKSLADETRMLVAMVMSNEPEVENWTGADDDDDNAAIPPPRRRNVDVSVSTGLIQEPVDDDDDDDGARDKVKSEDIIDLKEDKSDSSIKEKPRHATSKRKSSTAADLDEQAREGMMREGIKRIKFEEFDDEFDPAKLSDAAPGNRSPDLATEGVGPPPPPPDGKFHFMGGDDDDDSDDETAPNNTASNDAAISTPVQMAPNTDRDISGPGEEGAGAEDDEEEEELQLNVGKVYERTLVQLGKSLGESITDNPV